MSDLALDGTWDLDLDAEGRLSIVYDEAYVRQAVEVRLKHFKNEWFRDLNAGTDWYDKILGKATDLTRRAELRRRILGTPRVARIGQLSLDEDRTKRIMTVDFEAVLDSGLPLEIRFEVTT